MFFSHQMELELYLGLSSSVFLGIGLLIGYSRKKGKHRYLSPKEGFPDLLSKREMEMLSFLAEGKSNQEISELSFVSINTVKSHVKKIYQKLEVKNRTEAVSVAKKSGLIS